MSKEIIGRECRFVVHLPYIKEVRQDTCIIKEIIHYNDGTTEPNLRIVENYKRPFYVTKEPYRTHKQKKESEDINRLNVFYSTQSALPYETAKRLGFINREGTMRIVSKSPYLYGVDVDCRVFIKKEYMDKYPNLNTPFKVCVLDTEVNVDTNELIVLSVATKEHMYVAVNKSLIPEHRDPVKQIEYLYNKYAPKTELNKDIKIEIAILDTEIEMVEQTFRRIHIWQPDFLTGWNIVFDMEVIDKVCKDNGVETESILSDPSIPNNLKFFKMFIDKANKVTASGANKPPGPEERWHNFKCSSSFYIIDAMCAYNYVRAGGKKVPGGYGLDNVLIKELGKDFKKLKFEDDTKEHLIGPDYHRYMVKFKPLEYVVYNMWDVLSVLELDERTKDLQVSVPILSGYSSFDIFKSNPKKIVDSIYFFYLDDGRVLGCRDSTVEENDDISLKDWINMFPAYRIAENGYKCIIENPEMDTNIRGITLDAD